jgi:hypothetical protein
MMFTGSNDNLLAIARRIVVALDQGGTACPTETDDRP